MVVVLERSSCVLRSFGAISPRAIRPVTIAEDEIREGLRNEARAASSAVAESVDIGYRKFAAPDVILTGICSCGSAEVRNAVSFRASPALSRVLV